MHARPQSRNFLAPVCLPEWLAQERGPHPALESSTMATGAAFLVRLGTGGGLLGRIPTVVVRTRSADAQYPHEDKSKHSVIGLLHTRSSADLALEEKSMPAK